MNALCWPLKALNADVDGEALGVVVVAGGVDGWPNADGRTPNAEVCPNVLPEVLGVGCAGVLPNADMRCTKSVPPLTGLGLANGESLLKVPNVPPKLDVLPNGAGTV